MYQTALQAATVLVAMASEKIIWRLNFMSRSTGAVEKADCSSTGCFSNIIITEPNELKQIFVNILR